MNTLTVAVAVFTGVSLSGSVLGQSIARAATTPATPPTIATFTATPAIVIPGQSSTLRWFVTGASTIVISPAVGAVTGTSASVRPPATTSYTLTATNASGSSTATAQILVGSPPTIPSFRAAPAAITAGQSSTLSWTVTGSPVLSINQSVGAVTGTSVMVTPSATTAYTLTATNSFGAATAAVSILVGSPPTITSFQAAPAVITPGQSSTLSWTVTGSPSLSISQSVGRVTGTSITVRPTATTLYTLTASNYLGSATATVSVTVGNLPTITSFKATPAAISTGQSSTLKWVVTGSPVLTIDQSVGAVTGTSVVVRPSATTTYTLTATNSFGAATASLPVIVGGPPTITSFQTTPANIAPGQSTTLSWVGTGSTGMVIGPGVGPVTGTAVVVRPAVTTIYTLTATNSFGTATANATAVVTPTSLPVISAFSATPTSVGPGVSTTLRWAATGATSLRIDPGIGTVTGTSLMVRPTATTLYTFTATNALGSVPATAAVSYVPLITINSQVYQSEHALFIIPPPNQVTWTGPNSWGSVFSAANVDSYVSTLNGVFPDDYSFVVVTANQLVPNSVPSVQPLRHTADGIGLRSSGTGVPSICRYNIGGGAVVDGAYGVLDHEIGHNWGVFLQPELSDANGHWLASSTVLGQMAVTYSDDGYLTVKQIAGDPVQGFTWTAADNITKNETETFSPQDLYLQGLAAQFPDVYVLTAPVYKADHTVTYSSVAKYDQAWLVQKYGVRTPTYQTSSKRLRVGFLYIARNLNEIQTVYQPIERSIDHFVNGEQIDTTKFRFQVPFLQNTQYRASIDALLADLDGNQTPTLSMNGPSNVASSDGSAVVPFTAVDPDGPAPTVSCVPASANCAIQGQSVVLAGLPSGTYFFTIKAQDAGGKKSFAHLTVDVQ